MRLWTLIAIAALVAGAAGWWLSTAKPAADPRIVRVALSPSGRWLAAASASGTVSVMATGPGMLLARVAISGSVCNDVQFGPGDDVLGVAGRDLWVWKFQGPDLPRRVRKDGVNYGMAEWDPDGRSLLTVTGGGVIARIEAATGSMRWSACCTSIYGDVRYAPGGRIFVHGGHNPSRRDAASGVLLDKLVPARSGPAYGPVAFDLSRGHVCFGSQDGSVLCRDAGTLAPAAAPPRQPGWIESIAFSVDGERAALAVSGAGLRLWDRRTGAVTTTSGMPTSNVVLSADGSTAMFGTADGRIEFRSATDGRVSRSIDCR